MPDPYYRNSGFHITTYKADSACNVSYAWTVPLDAVVIAGQGTATATAGIKWGYKPGKINIKPSSSCGSGEAKCMVDVTDLRGRQILHKEGTAVRGASQVKPDLRDVANGIYLTRVSDGKTVQNIKLAKGDLNWYWCYVELVLIRQNPCSAVFLFVIL